MNTSLSVRPSVPDSPPEAPAPQGPVVLVHRVPRTTPIDRLVLRVAVAMLIWSTRTDAEHTPHVSELALSPHAPSYAAHAADDALARGALVHGVYLSSLGR